MFVRSSLMLVCFVSSDDKLYNSYLNFHTFNGLVDFLSLHYYFEFKFKLSLNLYSFLFDSW